MPEQSNTETSTYRPQYIHPERDLTPKEADINLLELKSEKSTEAIYLIPLFVSNTGESTPEINSFSARNCNGIKLGNFLFAFNSSEELMTVPLSNGKSISTKVRVLVAEIINGKYKVILTSGSA